MSLAEILNGKVGVTKRTDGLSEVDSLFCALDDRKRNATLEKSIKNPLVAVEYAARVLKDSWSSVGMRHLEVLISSQPWSAYQYCVRVLKRPWIEAEPIINSDPLTAKLYQRFKKQS